VGQNEQMFSTWQLAGFLAGFYQPQVTKSWPKTFFNSFSSWKLLHLLRQKIYVLLFFMTFLIG